MKQIPKKIILLNQDIKIILDNDYCQGKQVLGEADINHNIIKLCSYIDGGPVPFPRQRHTLFHEMIHYMLFFIGQGKLYKDELFTDNLAITLEDLILKNNFDKTLK